MHWAAQWHTPSILTAGYSFEVAYRTHDAAETEFELIQTHDLNPPDLTLNSLVVPNNYKGKIV